MADFSTNAATADLSQLAANLAAASGQSLTAVAASVVRETAERVKAQAQALAPVKTGALRNSINVTFTGPLTAVIGPHVLYAAYQEYGTASRGEFGGSPYVIRPVRAKRLVFQVDGKRVFAKEVHHPGVRAHPYMRPAAVQAVQDLQDSLGTTGVSLIVTGAK